MYYKKKKQFKTRRKKANLWLRIGKNKSEKKKNRKKSKKPETGS